MGITGLRSLSLPHRRACGFPHSAVEPGDSNRRKILWYNTSHQIFIQYSLLSIFSSVRVWLASRVPVSSWNPPISHHRWPNSCRSCNVRPCQNTARRFTEMFKMVCLLVLLPFTLPSFPGLFASGPLKLRVQFSSIKFSQRCGFPAMLSKKSIQPGSPTHAFVDIPCHT